MQYQNSRDQKIAVGETIFRRISGQNAFGEAEKIRTLRCGCRRWTLDITASAPDVIRFVGRDYSRPWSESSIRSFTVRIDEESLLSPQTYELLEEAMTRS
jgi:hypothetical protein